MPYKREGKCVYIKKSGSWKKKGCSASVEKAKKYLKKLYSVEEIIKEEYYIFQIENLLKTNLTEIFMPNVVSGLSGKEYGSNMTAEEWAGIVLNNPEDFVWQDVNYAKELKDKGYKHPRDVYGPRAPASVTNRMMRSGQTIGSVASEWAAFIRGGGDIRDAIEQTRSEEGKSVIQILKDLVHYLEDEKSAADKRAHGIQQETLEET